MTKMRRYDRSQMMPAELAIYNCMLMVETMGAHPRLTDAVTLLGQAREALADFIDTNDQKETAMLKTYHPRSERREEVYNVIDGERAYQDAGKGNAQRHADAPKSLSPGEFILCMEKCLADARDAWYKPGGGIACLDFVRKVSALGVQCMELHGAPPRK